MEWIEWFKNVAAIVGCIISTITLSSICIKPIRKWMVDKINQLSNKDEQDKAIQSQKMIQEEIIHKHNTDVAAINDSIKSLTNLINQVKESVSQLSDRILKNEADRLRSELFDCGNRCRREIVLSGEEFRHIQEVFKKYHDELHENSIGEDEYHFIKNYFNSKVNQDKLNKKYDN